MVPEDQVDTASQTAEALARAAKHGGGSDLPALANSKLDEAAAKSLLDWFRSLFKFKPSESNLNLEFLTTFLFWTALAFLVIGCGYLIYRAMKKMRGPAAPGQRGTPQPPRLSTDALFDDLAAALAAGQFARAARLRWRLFLLRIRRSPDVTPYEHFPKLAATPEDWLAKQYRTMFAGKVATKPDYDDLAAKLASLEPTNEVES